MPNASPLPRHVCPACEGHDSAACDACGGTGLRLCDCCGSVRAAASVDGTAVCLGCALIGLSETEEAAHVAAGEWRAALRSPAAYPSEKTKAYARMKVLARLVAASREAIQDALVGSAANDTTPAPPPPEPAASALDWRTVELRAGFGLVFGRIADIGYGWTLRWTQGGVEHEVRGDSWLGTKRSAESRISEMSRVDADDTLVTERPALAH